jgi:hypothetical protein
MRKPAVSDACIHRRRPSPIAAVYLPALVAVFGCGGPPSGTVQGRVTFKDEPVALGTIAFHGADGRVASGSISGGAYRVEKISVGPATLTVQAHPPMAPLVPPPDENGPSGSPAPSPIAFARRPVVALPGRYATRNTSGLIYEVRDGRQTHDVILAP